MATEPMHILLVDDEAALTEPLSRALRREGYVVNVAADGPRGYQQAVTVAYDLVILDWLLPGCSGLEVCQRLRSHGETVPVLFLTAKDTVGDRVLGLDGGADDYLVKPFELRELLARVRALLRRSPHLEPRPSPRLQAADLGLDCDSQVAHRGSRVIALSEKESQLLALLMRSPGQLLTHDHILNQLWPEEKKPTSNVLPAQIRLLRRKIDQPGEVPLIQTVYGKGYRLGS